jgi:hypothetical protein
MNHNIRHLTTPTDYHKTNNAAMVLDQRSRAQRFVVQQSHIELEH